ncbi:AAA family ATPase [Acinetobacter vivianii]|uniref:AAA family ATPase n=1 Tax=Acinetobacter vivianii TaxID=1776742 RepID=A0AAJ6P4P8_9GAMM|nr:AAA family ATPase [Acinetobacter vivianii]WDZ50586.1 AAA family ATPase [Acinetobacter vivianii]
MSEKIIGLKIKSLFDRFNYEINLKDNKLVIITAPNGYGKSTILNIIRAFSSNDFFYLLNEKFVELIFEFDNHSPVSIKKIESKTSSDFFDDEVININESKIVISSKNKRSQIIDHRLVDRLCERAEGYMPISRMNANKWIDERNGVIYDKASLVSNFISNSIFRDQLKIENWLLDLSSSLTVQFIPTNRLSQQVSISPRRVRAELSNNLMVEIIAREIKTEIDKEIKNQYNEGRKRETNFPKRLMEALNSTREVSIDEIQSLITKIQYYESNYLRLGIVPDIGLTEQLGLSTSSTDSELAAGRVVLKTYLSDVIEKFKILDELANKLDLFTKSINKLMAFKKIFINAEKGFDVKTFEGDFIEDSINYSKVVPLNSLSSGEQHLIVLIGKLIFSNIKDGLILIDEPEISLHPAWQEKFLEILMSIQELTKFDLLIATHSPQLIGDRWDDVIELAEQVS